MYSEQSKTVGLEKVPTVLVYTCPAVMPNIVYLALTNRADAVGPPARTRALSLILIILS